MGIEDIFKKLNEVSEQAKVHDNQQFQTARLKYCKWAVEMTYKYKLPIKNVFKDVENALTELTKTKD